MEKIKKKINFLDWPKFSNFDAKSIKKVLLSGKVNYWSGKRQENLNKCSKKI